MLFNMDFVFRSRNLTFQRPSVGKMGEVVVYTGVRVGLANCDCHLLAYIYLYVYIYR